MANIGFLKQPSPDPEWDGPVLLTFVRHPDYAKTKTKTARYRLAGNFRISFYIPLFMLRNIDPEEVPSTVLVSIERSREPGHALGFLSQPLKLRLESEACEYALSNRTSPMSSKRYDFEHDGQTYSLYLPNSIFASQRNPERLWVQLGVPVS